MGCTQYFPPTVHVIPFVQNNFVTITFRMAEFQEQHPNSVQVLCKGYLPEHEETVQTIFKHAIPGIYDFDCRDLGK